MTEINELWYLILLILSVQLLICGAGEMSIEEESYGVKYASPCEVCKYVVTELEDRLKETGKSHDVIQTGYELDSPSKKKIKYSKSELRLLESLDGVCEKLLEYNIHKERKDSTRFAKGMSTTFQVLHGLVDKGVKVDLGIPLELWDKPSAEVTNLKTQCENLIEDHEEIIEDWYFNHQDIPLKKFLCVDHALKKGDDGCLEENLPEKAKGEENAIPSKKRQSKKNINTSKEKSHMNSQDKQTGGEELAKKLRNEL